MPKLKDMWPLLAAGGIGAAMLLKGGLGGNCGTCKGSGKAGSRTCGTCGGSGQLPSNEALINQPTDQSVQQLKNVMQVRGLNPQGPGQSLRSAQINPSDYMG